MGKCTARGRGPTLKSVMRECGIGVASQSEIDEMYAELDVTFSDAPTPTDPYDTNQTRKDKE